MEFIDRWDLFLLFVATYVAVVSLVRLMRNRRDELVTQVRGQIRAEQLRRAEAEKRAAKKQRERNRDAA